uniref:Alba DNA/RNA-binding protein n=1 Tax=Zea mays TaxID=4577 RepID=A0A804PN76_MAIZE
MVVELIKRRIVGLHQNTTTGSTDITDMWEPLEEGLLPLETTRHVSMITITLSKKELDKSSIGLLHASYYQIWICGANTYSISRLAYDFEG